MEEKPDKGNKRFWELNVGSWEDVLGSPSLFALFLHFSPGICCLAGPWLVLQVWHASCPQSDRFLVQDVREPVAFTARCTLGPFCCWSVHVNMTLGFLLLCP